MFVIKLAENEITGLLDVIKVQYTLQKSHKTEITNWMDYYHMLFILIQHCTACTRTVMHALHALTSASFYLWGSVRAACA